MNIKSLPKELIVLILNFLPFQNMVEIIFVSKYFHDIIMSYPWKISDFILSYSKDCTILMKFKPRITTLIISNLDYKTEQDIIYFTCYIYNYYQRNRKDLQWVNLSNIIYENLVFENVICGSLEDITKFDSRIGVKCKKLVLHNVYFKSKFINSLRYLQKCKKIVLVECRGSVILDNPWFLEYLKNLPKLRKITLSITKYVLYDYQLQLLSNYDTIIIKNMRIIGDINNLCNYSQLRLIACNLNGLYIDKTFSCKIMIKK